MRKNPGKNLFQVFISATLLCLLCSCERIMYLDAGGKPQVVVECILVTEPEQTLKLTYSKGSSKSEIEPVREAEAVLVDLSDGSVHEFRKESDGVWKLDFGPEQKGSYRLEVRVPGYDLLSAEQTMPELKASAGRMNCSIIPHHHRYSYCPLNYSVARDLERPYTLFVRALNYNEQTGTREQAEYICTDHETVDDNVTDQLYEGPLYPDIIGHPLHKGSVALRIEENKGGGNYVHFSISGEFKGKFPSYSFYGGTGCRIIDSGVVNNPGPEEGYLEFSRLSSELEKFYECVKEFQEIQESTDMSTIYLRDNIYTNIEGGLGFFGSRIIVKMVWSPDPLPDDDFYYADAV